VGAGVGVGLRVGLNVWFANVHVGV
jgi:hypothetical protein